MKRVVDRKGCETPKGKTTRGWVFDVRCQLKSTVDWKGCKKKKKNGVEPRAGWYLTVMRQLKSIVDWKGCQIQAFEPRVAGFLTGVCQLKNVVDWKGCQTPKGKTTGGWVSVRRVSTEERSRLDGMSKNTGTV